LAHTLWHDALNLLLPVLFLFLATVSWALIVFQLPGNWGVLLLALLYGWYEGFHAMAWWVLLMGLAMASTGELLEWLAGYHGTRRFGGGRAAGWAAIAGSIVGALLGAGFGWGLGAIPGTVLGAFVGALLAEAIRQRRTGGALKAGLGAAFGRAIGLSGKMGLGAAFLALLYFRVIWTALAKG
jgi:uncharacterized protein YqgC (DUF456 family)